MGKYVINSLSLMWLDGDYNKYLADKNTGSPGETTCIPGLEGKIDSMSKISRNICLKVLQMPCRGGPHP